MVKEFSSLRKGAERKLTMLDNASDLKELLAPVGNRREILKLTHYPLPYTLDSGPPWS
jgi:plasmid maintenance system killer protein